MTVESLLLLYKLMDGTHNEYVHSVDPPWRTTPTTCKHRQCCFPDISESRIFDLVRTTFRAQRNAALVWNSGGVMRTKTNLQYL